MGEACDDCGRPDVDLMVWEGGPVRVLPNGHHRDPMICEACARGWGIDWIDDNEEI